MKNQIWKVFIWTTRQSRGRSWVIFEAIVREAGVALSWHTNKLVAGRSVDWRRKKKKKLETNAGENWSNLTWALTEWSGEKVGTAVGIGVPVEKTVYKRYSHRDVTHSLERTCFCCCLSWCFEMRHDKWSDWETDRRNTPITMALKLGCKAHCTLWATFNPVEWLDQWHAPV